MKMLRRAICLLVALCVGSQSNLVLASSLDSAIKGMFGNMTNVTDAVSGQSQNRGIFAGPSLYVRTKPVTTIQLMTLKTPSFKGGCGNIDFSLGAFSFMKIDAIINQLKTVAQGAAPYFFKLAISSMCKDCMVEMDKLAKDLNDMAKISIDSCKAAEAVADSFNGNDKKLQDMIAGKQRQIEGFADDFSATVFKADKAPSAQLKEDRGDITPLTGNVVWKVLTENNVASWFSLFTIASPANLKLELMSLYGTVVAADSTNANYVGPAETDDPLVVNVFGSTITYEDLMDGNPLAEFLNCTDGTDGDCLYVTDGNPANTIDIVGIRKAVQIRLIGNDGKSGIVAGLTAMASNGGEILSDDDQQFLMQLPGSVKAQLMNLAGDPAAARGSAQILSTVIANEILHSFLKELTEKIRLTLRRVALADQARAKMMEDRLVEFAKSEHASYIAYGSSVKNYADMINANKMIRSSINGGQQNTRFN